MRHDNFHSEFAQLSNKFFLWQQSLMLVGELFFSFSTFRNKLLGKQTYAAPAIHAIGKSMLPHSESISSTRTYWTLDFNFSKQAPYVKLLNIKDDEENNGITCFIKELIILAGFINSKQGLVDDVLFKTNSIKSDLNDKELFH